MARYYALHVFEGHARQQLALQRAYKTFRDVVATCKFVSQDLDEIIITPAASDFLQVGYWNHVRNGMPVWARLSSDGRTVTFKHGNDRESLQEAEEIYTIGGHANVQGVLAPFNYTRPARWPKAEHTKIEVHEEATRVAHLAVKLVFLITGRIEEVTSDDDEDTLVLFKQLCDRMPDTAEGTGETKKLEPASASRTSSKVLGKRSANYSSLDDDYTESYSRLSLEPIDRPRKSSRISTSHVLSTLGSDGEEDPSEKLKVRVAAAAEQYKLEVLDDHNKTKQADAKKIKRLEAQLAASKKEIQDRKMEAEEWKTKFEEADAVLQPIIKFTRK